MRAASRFSVFALVLLMAAPALAKDNKKKPRKSADTEEAAEPAPKADSSADDSGWGDSMMQDIKGTKKSAKPAKGKAKPAEPPPEEVEPVADEPVEPVAEEPVEPKPEPIADDKPAEDEAAPKTKPEWWIGAYLHDAIVPSFMLGLFLESPPSIANAAFGLTATHRSQDGMSFVMGLGYQSYSFEGPLQKTGDPDEDTEIATSTLGLVHVTGQILWSTDIGSMFSFEYGIGLDLGFITGDLHRSEAYRAVPGAPFQKCGGPLNPASIAPSGVPYCNVPTTKGVPDGRPTSGADELGEQYNVVEDRVPPVALIPALPQLALRFTPVRNVAIKLEASYGVFQFAFGLSAAYGLDL